MFASGVTSIVFDDGDALNFLSFSGFSCLFCFLGISFFANRIVRTIIININCCRSFELQDTNINFKTRTNMSEQEVQSCVFVPARGRSQGTEKRTVAAQDQKFTAKLRLV